MIDDSINHEYIIRYIRGMFSEPTLFFDKLRKFAVENDVPICEPETAAFLHFLCSVKRPSRILEVGTAIGYSALLMADACDATIVSLERNEEMIKLAKQNITEAGMNERIRIIEGDAVETVKTISDSFDLVFIDASKAHYNDFFNEIHINSGGVFVCDNILYKGMTATDELVQKRKVTIVKRLRKFISEVYESPEFDSSVIPLGDGILLSCKK